MKINVDRHLPIPVAEQIKGQISYAIACGLLSGGDPLPSVRELSTTLHVAPVTVSHAYRELARQGLINTKQGVGAFVADIACISSGNRLETPEENLRQVVDNCLRQGLLLGYSVEDIQRMFLELAKKYRSESAVRQIVIVGNFKPATESYARDLESILHDLNVKVLPMLVEDLAHPNGLRKELQSANLVITVPTRLQEVNRLLKAKRTRVTAVAFRPSLETRRKIAAISPNRRIGIVATYPEFLQTLAAEVSSYSMTKESSPCVVVDDEARVRSMLEKIDVVIYASGSERVLEWLPPDVQAIEFRHAPDPDSVNRLRPLLG